MVGEVIRAVEVPVSLSLAVARKSAAFAGRVTGWALSGIVREVLPGTDGSGGESHEATDHGPPAQTALAPEQGPALAENGEWAVDPPKRSFGAAFAEAEPTAIEEAEPDQSANEMVERPSTPGEQFSATAVQETSPAAADETRPATAPPGTQPAGDEDDHRAEVISGEEGTVVEHEPGLGTSVRARSPHSALNNPVTEPDITEWPDPYDKREDPRDAGDEMVFGGEAGHTQPGATSTSEPHPSQDPEAVPWEGPKRDKVDR